MAAKKKAPSKKKPSRKGGSKPEAAPQRKKQRELPNDEAWLELVRTSVMKRSG